MSFLVVLVWMWFMLVLVISAMWCWVTTVRLISIPDCPAGVVNDKVDFDGLPSLRWCRRDRHW